MIARALAILIAVVLVACGEAPSSPDASGPGPLPRFELHGPAAGLEQAIVMESVVPRTGPSPDGPELMDEFGENVQPIEAGRRVVVLTDPMAGPDGTWVRAYVTADPQVWPGDFFAWLPATQNGRPTLRPNDTAACPVVATIASLSRLVPPDRLRCAGDAVFSMDVRTWLPASYTGYEVDPAWFGSNSDLRRSVALFDAGDDPFAKGAPRSAEAAGFWIDARVPPAAGDLPPGMLVRVTGRFGDPAADTCARKRSPELAPLGPPGSGLPLEAKVDSVEWCREQFVVSRWEVLLGPEGRPIEHDAPQLLRSWSFDQPPGVQTACGGVGMAQLTMRIDPDRVNPVWIEVQGGGMSLALFGRGLRLVLAPGPAVVGDNGVRLVDGEIIDPDRGKPGLAVCPEGSVVEFELLP